LETSEIDVSGRNEGGPQKGDYSGLRVVMSAQREKNSYRDMTEKKKGNVGGRVEAEGRKKKKEAVGRQRGVTRKSGIEKIERPFKGGGA